MNFLHIIFLAVVQGLTEFLPVSSTGHLVLFQSLLGMQDSTVTLDVILHAGTLAAVFVVFRKDLQRILTDLWQTSHTKAWRRQLIEDTGVRSLFLIIVASIPTGIIGLVFREEFTALFQKPEWVGLFLMITGVFLWCSGFKNQKRKRGIAETTAWMALLIGLVQGMAILPGISRSGATIVVALFLGLNSSWAARFSFLMSIPAILGATVLELSQITLQDGHLLHFLTGFIVALLVGILALHWVVDALKKGHFRLFSYYVFPVGLLAFGYFNFFR